MYTSHAPWKRERNISPNDKILDFFELDSLADDKINPSLSLKFVYITTWNIVKKGENATVTDVETNGDGNNLIWGSLAMGANMGIVAFPGKYMNKKKNTVLIYILSLSQTTKFRLFQIEGISRQQFQIWYKWQKVHKTGRKHSGKRRNCSLRAISPFPTVFSKHLCCRHVKTRACLGKGEIVHNLFNSVNVKRRK